MEVLDPSHREVTLCVVVITVSGEIRPGDDPKFAAYGFPQPHINGVYVRNGSNPEFNIKVK